MIRLLLRRMRRNHRKTAFKEKLLILVVSFLASFLLYKIAGPRKVNYIRRNKVPHGWTGSSSDACIHPDLPVWNKDVLDYVKKVDLIVCDNEIDWVYSRNGKIYISAEADSKHGGIKCVVAPIFNVDGSFIIKKPSKLVNGTDLISDAFKVLCAGRDGVQYKNIRPCITNDRHKYINDTGRVNVLIYGFDSMSRNMVRRMLPKTHAYFTKRLGGMLLSGYNIVEGGTSQAFLPMLTGLSPRELLESRQGQHGSKLIDELVTFVWKRYAQQGYVTQWGEDIAHVETFLSLFFRFKEQPVDHYIRAFQIFSQNFFIRLNRNLCLGSRPRHAVFLDWLKEGLETNRGRNFFTFGFFSEYSHDNNNLVRLADGDTAEFLKFLSNKGFLDDTILILMSNHGIDHGAFRETEQGKLEERMPYFGFRFPDKFKRTYPKKMEAFMANTEHLSTPFDVHETLVEMIDENEAHNRRISGKFKGQSLFTEIPSSRTCYSAGIDPHWCACMQWSDVVVDDLNVRRAAMSVVELINTMLKPYGSLCQHITLSKVTKASLSTIDGHIPDLSGTLKPKDSIYQIVFSTLPRKVLYEATVRKLMENGTFVTNKRHIRRLNRFGDVSKCISKKHQGLWPYCVCKTI